MGVSWAHRSLESGGHPGPHLRRRGACACCQSSGSSCPIWTCGLACRHRLWRGTSPPRSGAISGRRRRLASSRTRSRREGAQRRAPGVGRAFDDWGLPGPGASVRGGRLGRPSSARRGGRPRAGWRRRRRRRRGRGGNLRRSGAAGGARGCASAGSAGVVNGGAGRAGAVNGGGSVLRRLPRMVGVGRGRECATSAASKKRQALLGRRSKGRSCVVKQSGPSGGGAMELANLASVQ